ncbi:hypothetical protein JET66_13565 [Pseudomonas putida]|uniref:hypothetical protein n=1 Tax=Pseudomonas putida TaxID=303 RepID=UPI0018E69B34|nr:hypothetical protein [Pseudomonas putida]MBI6925678.1 hypothetical protein [Pseudomonas putida]
MESNLPEWMWYLKLLGSVAFGFVSSAVLFLWKEHKDSKKEARNNYNEALDIASQNRDATQDGVMIVYEFLQRIQASPHKQILDVARNEFQSVLQKVAEPNAKSAQEFYASLYDYDKEMSLADSRRCLKQAKHFLATNQAANRGILRKLDIIGVTLQLQSASTGE